MLFIAALNRDGDAARARIMQVVRSLPGSHTATISDKTGLAWSTVDYHLRVLRRNNILKLVKSRRECYAFPLEIEPDQHMWFATLRDEGANAVFLRLIQMPGQGVPGLSAWFGMSHKIIRRQLNDLVDSGLVTKRGLGRPTFEPNHDVVKQLPVELLGHGLEPGRPTGSLDFS